MIIHFEMIQNLCTFWEKQEQILWGIHFLTCHIYMNIKFINMKKNCIIGVLLVLTSLCSFAQNFPFPQNEAGYTYPYGISASTPDNSKIQSKFESWDKTMYAESSDGQYGRIVYDDEDYTVSEGIGYGMLIYVYMANETNTQCQDRFDKLYAYYKKWVNGNGLMNWKIQGFSNVASDGYNAATDADLDVALALCLAAKQWGYSSNYVYATEAESLLSKIYNKEVTTKNGYKVFKPGDTWERFGNPCYFTVASVGVFDQAQEALGFSSTKDWESVYEGTHTWLELTQKNGLWPNWAFWDGSLGVSGYDNADDYGWDACRTPWRIAWDYVWFGNESSKNMLTKTMELMDAKGILSSPNYKAGFFTDLDASSYSGVSYVNYGNNAAFIGGFASALMCDETKQTNLDSYHSSLKSRSDNPYYAPTLQVLYLLTTSGNAANFFAIDDATTNTPIISKAETDGNTITLTSNMNLQSSSDYSNFTLYVNGTEQSQAFTALSISDKTITLTLNTSTISLNNTDIITLSYEGTTIVSEDGEALGSVLMRPVTNNIYGGSTLLADCENGETTLLGGTWYSYCDQNSSASYAIESGGANSTANGAHFTYTSIQEYGGMGFNILDGENESYDFTGSTGITFYHKGNAAVLEVATPTTSDYSYHIYNVDYHSDWTLVTVNWTNLTGPGWGTGESIDFSEGELYSEIIKFQWKETSGSGEFWIDEVTLVGKTIASSDVDKSTLEATLATANSLYGSASEDSYPSSAITTFKNAITTAATEYMNTASTQTTVDNANTVLLEAIETFKASAYADKTELEYLIAEATALGNNATIGTGNGEYPQSAKDALDEAIAEAQEQYDIVGLTEVQRDAAIEALQEAMDTFKASILVVIDKEELGELITLSENILNTTTAGTEVGQYSESKRSDLEKKLKTAKNLYETSTSQTVVNMYVTTLKNAYNAYMASKVEATGIDEESTTITVYPNPCSDIAYIETSNTILYVQVITMKGETLMKTTVQDGSINMSTLPNGIYTLVIVFDNGDQILSRIMKK